MEAVPLSRTADDQTLQDWSAPLLPRLLAPQQPTCRPTVHHALPSTRDDELVARCEKAGSCVSLVEHKQADASVQYIWVVVDRQEQRNHHSLPIQFTRPACTVLTAVVRGQARATWAAVYEHETVPTSDIWDLDMAIDVSKCGNEQESAWLSRGVHRSDKVLIFQGSRPNYSCNEPSRISRFADGLLP